MATISDIAQAGNTPGGALPSHSVTPAQEQNLQPPLLLTPSTPSGSSTQ